MCDKDHFKEFEKSGRLAVAMPPQTAEAAVAVTESEVAIETPDGTCDAYFVRPSSGAAPGVLFWPDIFGLRPALRQMGKRLAQEGYSVLVVNPFYRTTKASATDEPLAIPPSGPILERVQTITAKTDSMDTKAFVAWLDQQPSVAKSRKIGTHGYCLGGTSALRAAAAVPDRIGAAAAFHGYKLVTTNPDSPHLLAARSKASLLVAIGSDDDKESPNDKDVMKDTFAKADRPAEIEVYEGFHGWCIPDFPIYDQAQAGKAWARLLALYSKALA